MSTTLALGKELQAFIHAMVASGRYGDESEVVSASLRLLAEQDSDLAARRDELFRSFDEALKDVRAGNGVSLDEVDAHFERRVKDGAGRFRA